MTVTVTEAELQDEWLALSAEVTRSTPAKPPRRTVGEGRWRRGELLRLARPCPTNVPVTRTRARHRADCSYKAYLKEGSALEAWDQKNTSSPARSLGLLPRLPSSPLADRRPKPCTFRRGLCKVHPFCHVMDMGRTVTAGARYCSTTLATSLFC